MENPEEILHSLEEFAKLRPKDIPKELEDYLCFVAKTGDPVYQWSSVKSLFREKLVNVITEFYESCPSVEIPPCPNVDVFNYEIMKNFILEKLDTFAAAPFTVQRICELLTTPRKEYNRIDKYMRALEKNILVVSTTEPGNRRTENGENVVNGIDSENGYDTNNSNSDINVEEMDDVPSWPRLNQNETTAYQSPDINEPHTSESVEIVQETFVSDSSSNESACTSTVDTVITKTNEPYVSIEPIASDTCNRQESSESDVSVTITAIPAAVQKRRDSIEPVVSSEQTEQVTECASSSSESDSLNATDREKPSDIVETNLEPLINVESSITTSETEVSAVTCSETTGEYVSSENCIDNPVTIILPKEESLEDTNEESSNSCESNFLIAATNEETTPNDEITTSAIQISETPLSEVKENLITSSNTVEEVITELPNEVPEKSNEAETTETSREQATDILETNETTDENKTPIDKEDDVKTNDMAMEVDNDEQSLKSNENVV